MFIYKKKYYLFVENTRRFNFNLIKKRKKFHIIYRNNNTKEKLLDLIEFRNNCRKKGIHFYVSNNTVLLSRLRADGLYISAYNNNLLLNIFSRIGYKLIGSAHNLKEIDIKVKQGCREIIYSRLFKTNYSYKKGHLGVNKFNIVSIRSKVELVPLGGINKDNLSKVKSVRCNSFACLSAIKKKPAKIINRLF